MTTPADPLGPHEVRDVIETLRRAITFGTIDQVISLGHGILQDPSLDAHTRIVVHYQVGLRYGMTGRFEEAAKQFEQALTLMGNTPYDEDLVVYLTVSAAAAYHAVGKHDQALDLLHRLRDSAEPHTTVRAISGEMRVVLLSLLDTMKAMVNP